MVPSVCLPVMICMCSQSFSGLAIKLTHQHLCITLHSEGSADTSMALSLSVFGYLVLYMYKHTVLGGHENNILP